MMGGHANAAISPKDFIQSVRVVQHHYRKNVQNVKKIFVKSV